MAGDPRVREESARPISCVGLAEGEAKLMLRQHGEESRRIAVD